MLVYSVNETIHYFCACQLLATKYPLINLNPVYQLFP